MGLHTLQVTVNIAEGRLSATDIPYVWAIMQAKPGNAGTIYGPGPDNTVSATSGAAHLPGGASVNMVAMGSQRAYNLKEQHAAASVDGCILNITYWD